MKRVWFALVLLAALLGGSVTVSHFVQNYATETQILVQEADKALRMENPQQAAELCEKAAGLWKKRSRFLTTVLRHDVTDGVESGLQRLIAFAQTEDTDEFLAECGELWLELEHIQDMEKPYLRNIL